MAGSWALGDPVSLPASRPGWLRGAPRSRDPFQGTAAQHPSLLTDWGSKVGRGHWHLGAAIHSFGTPPQLRKGMRGQWGHRGLRGAAHGGIQAGEVVRNGFLERKRNGMQLENGKNTGDRSRGLGMGLEASEDPG